MSLQGFTIIFLAIVQHSLCYEKMDESSKDPILQFLQLDTDSQPEHEFVKIELLDRLHKRAFSNAIIPAGMGLRIRAFGNNVDLWLHPGDSILATGDTPIYNSTYSPGSPGNVRIGRVFNLMKTLGSILEDPKHLASLAIGTDDYGRMTVNGRIGSKRLVIRSLPKSIVNEYVRKRRSIDDLDEDFANSTHHVVYRIKDDSEENSLLGAFNETTLRERVARSTSGIPYILYPKILVVVDYSMYKVHGSDIYRFLEYLLAFWNGVDLKYRELENPRVRLHIAGILIGVDPDAIPYISNSMIGYKAFTGKQALEDSTKFFYKIKDSIPLAMYDVAITLTSAARNFDWWSLFSDGHCKYYFVRLNFGLGRDAYVTGKTFVSAACTNLTSDELMLASAIVRDNGGFFGVLIAAHELGHLLGMKHDELQSDDCMYSNGFIMAKVAIYTSNSTSFSKCSMMNLQERLDQQDLKCMYNAPHIYSGKLPKLIPGKIVDREEQCKLHGLGMPCNDGNVEICVNLYCRTSNGYCRKVYDATLEGTQCNAKNETPARFCVHSQCVYV